MPTNPTVNLGLVAPISATDQVYVGPQNFQSIINVLDAGPTGPVVTRVLAGTQASLPSAASEPLGTLYHCTDVSCGFIRNAAVGWTYLPFGQSLPPIGSIASYGGASDPVDPDGNVRWFVCDGRAISRTTYSACFGFMGTTYGSGNGSTTFNIPNGQGNVLVGKSGSFAMGSTGGETTHLLSSGEMPSHTHTDAGHTHSDSGHSHGRTGTAMTPAVTAVTQGGGSAVTTTGGTSTTSINTGFASITTGFASVSSTGGGGAHNNLQPYVVTTHIVRVL